MDAAKEYIEAAAIAKTLYEINLEDIIRELCRRRAEFEAHERHTQKELAQKGKLLAEKRCSNYGVDTNQLILNSDPLVLVSDQLGKGCSNHGLISD